MKLRGEKIVVLTAYDAPTARDEHDAGIDLILVGDSVGTTVLGYADEREVTLADIAHHVAAVRRGAPEATILADLPYATYDTPEAAVANARRLVQAGADMVKFEGARPQIARALAAAGIAASGHLGLECQHHDERRLKARTAPAAMRLEHDAVELLRGRSRAAHSRADPRGGGHTHHQGGADADDRDRRGARHRRAGAGDPRRPRA